MQLIEAGDPTGIDLLYEKHAPALYTLIVQIVGNRETSNTILIRTFRNLRESLKGYHSGQSSLFVWLLRLTRTAALEQLKDADGGRPGPKIPDPNKKVQARRHRALIADNPIGLRKVLDELDEKSRTLIDLHYFRGCEINEISRHLELTDEVAATQIRQALVLFHKKLLNGVGR